VRVLNLVTNPRARFFVQQVRALGERGVDGATISVPGEYRGNGEGRSALDYARFYPRVLRASLGSFDLVHANSGLTAPHALAQPTRPVVLSLWGTDLLGEYGWVSRRCARHVDAVVVMSEAMADALDVPAHVIPHGVDLDRFRPAPAAEARDELGWDPDARHVLFPYPPDVPVKDYPRAERVVDAARGRLDGPVELHALGGIPHRKMPTFVNAADCLLVTSKREGSPNAVKEALACDLPVVATPVGDVPDRLDGVTPSTVAGDDAALAGGLADVLRDPTPSNGREAVESLDLDRMTARLASVYESALDGAASGRDC